MNELPLPNNQRMNNCPFALTHSQYSWETILFTSKTFTTIIILWSNLFKLPHQTCLLL